MLIASFDVEMIQRWFVSSWPTVTLHKCQGHRNEHEHTLYKSTIMPSLNAIAFKNIVLRYYNFVQVTHLSNCDFEWTLISVLGWIVRTEKMRTMYFSGLCKYTYTKVISKTKNSVVCITEREKELQHLILLKDGVARLFGWASVHGLFLI